MIERSKTLAPAAAVPCRVRLASCLPLLSHHDERLAHMDRACLNFSTADAPTPQDDFGPDPDIDIIIQLLEALEDHLAPPVAPESYAPRPGD